MKKVMLIGALVVGAITFTSATLLNGSNETIENVETTGSSFKLINDTSEKVKVHTGTGETSLNPRGGSTSISCKSGKNVKVNGKVIFKISEDLCGQTVKISKYM
jgi:RNase P/RNase MRP subunit p29